MFDNWEIYNKNGTSRILVTKMLPGSGWLDVLLKSNYSVEVYGSDSTISKEELLEKIGGYCAGVIGQLTERWDSDLFQALRNAGGKVYCNYAVGYDNIDLEAAAQNRIAVGNTPGVLTETTAEMAVALTLSCARRIVEADGFMRSGYYKGWLPNLFLGQLLRGKTVGIVGAGRIGSAYALMMCQGFHMNLIYHSRNENKRIENTLNKYNDFLRETNSDTIRVKRADSLKEVLEISDVVSLHVPLTKETHHLIRTAQLSVMKKDAILINTSRGAVIDEIALADHCQNNENFRAGLDVFEEEPMINQKLKGLPNVTVTPHIASATHWTREGMAKLAALNILGFLEHYPLWRKDDMGPFLGNNPPKAIPSIVNADALDIVSI